MWIPWCCPLLETTNECQLPRHLKQNIKVLISKSVNSFAQYKNITKPGKNKLKASQSQERLDHPGSGNLLRIWNYKWGHKWGLAKSYLHSRGTKTLTYVLRIWTVCLGISFLPHQKHLWQHCTLARLLGAQWWQSESPHRRTNSFSGALSLLKTFSFFFSHHIRPDIFQKLDECSKTLNKFYSTTEKRWKALPRQGNVTQVEILSSICSLERKQVRNNPHVTRGIQLF